MGRLRFYFDGLRHFFVAHSRHGTHSPFVYRLVDEVIYAKRLPGEPRDKAKRLTARLIDRFQPDMVFILANEPIPTARPDFVIVDAGTLEEPVAQLEALWPQLHAGSVMVLPGIYRDTGAKALWKSIKIKPEVTVTIDLFHVGLVFFHAGQCKEDFKIRY
ncbi:hypothetical protein [Parapedobacter sp. 10938]|uniref:hypothetical protein n=1 Tax=Parapedobacter flavus TaxID=3110225 RepID=UPI002DBA70C9|nr:hypothetical protein [Parapedobacter sp. 10938]MEC3881109.1 hypothetical protein [Parapedobacter sp. 10938]